MTKHVAKTPTVRLRQGYMIGYGCNKFVHAEFLSKFSLFARKRPSEFQ